MPNWTPCERRARLAAAGQPGHRGPRRSAATQGRRVGGTNATRWPPGTPRRPGSSASGRSSRCTWTWPATHPGPRARRHDPARRHRRRRQSRPARHVRGDHRVVPRSLRFPPAQLRGLVRLPVAGPTRRPRSLVPRRTRRRAGRRADLAQRVRRPSADADYVANLGVLRSGRGRGVAKALLHAAFARAQADGRAAVRLHVDAESPTGATRLYESVGMYRRVVG
ncbi:MAG: GNAT family N-acetyltransferase [Micropruina sp.]